MRSAFAFGSGHGFRVDEWSAPSLLGQALYGGLLIRFFSPKFLVLRLSTLLLSCCTVIALWGSFRRIGLHRGLVGLMLLAWIFDPLQFNLAFTFMTEIPFLFFVALGIYLYVVHLDKGKSWPLAMSAAALGYAFLIRQTAACFILALIGSLMMDSQKGILDRIRKTILVAGTVGAFVAGYYAWVMFKGGTTAAVHRKFELLNHLTTKQIAGNSFGMVFYLAFMIMPVWLYLLPHMYRTACNFNKSVGIGIVAAWSLVILSGLWWFRTHCAQAVYLPSTAYHARMPFLLNVLYDTGLGPITLDPAYFGPAPTPIYPNAWLVITAIVAAGAVVLASICTFGLIRRRALRIFQERRPLFVFSGLAFISIACFEVIFSHLQEGGLFDRHILSAALPFCFLVALFSGGKDKDTGGKKALGWAWLPAGTALTALSLFCVCATHDYMEWNRLRWDMGRGLLEQGVDPLAIVGGFEFNAWYNYDTFVARGNIAKVRQWWYDRRDYMITMSPSGGYDILQKKEYFSWVHRRPVAIYVIRDSRLKIRN